MESGMGKTAGEGTLQAVRGSPELHGLDNLAPVRRGDI